MQRITTNLSLFDRAVQSLASMPLLYVISLLALVGLCMFGQGAYEEVQSMRELRQHAGTSAVTEYRADSERHQLPVVDYVRAGLRGELRQYGGNMQIVGMTVLYAGSIVAMLSVLSARLVWSLQLRFGAVAGHRRKPKK